MAPMTLEQEAHLARVQTAFARKVDAKYRKGQAEHGGDLLDRSALALLDMAIEEAVDQVVYLESIREKMVTGT